MLVLATSSGGTGAHVRSLVVSLAAAAVQVTVCGPRSTQDTFGFASAGACFVPVEIAAGPRPVGDTRAVLALRAAVGGAALVHAHGLRAGLVAAVATPGGSPYVLTWHNAPLSGGPLGVMSAIARRVAARRADVSLCVSPDLEALIRSAGGRDVRPGPVAGPPLRPPARSPAAVRDDLAAGHRPLVLSVGRLHAQKGYPHLIAAAHLLGGRRPSPLFVVAGEGPDREALATAITRLGAPVRLLGWRHDLADLLAAADVVVSSSIWEGSPLAVQEALRAGRPLVATAVGGVPSLVGRGADLVPASDPAALARAIAGVLDDPAHAATLISLGREAAARLPTEASTVRTVRAVYAELLGHPV